MKRWAVPSLLVILVGLLSFSTGCHTESVYRPTSDQVFLLPPGTSLVAPPGQRITTDDGHQKVELERVALPYSGVVLSDGRFLLLYRATQDK
jgi:hypothetical protein